MFNVFLYFFMRRDRLETKTFENETTTLPWTLTLTLNLTHSQPLKMLGVTITNHMSASEHVSDDISRCAQSIHAVRTLRSNGMNDDILQVIYKTVNLSKISYASSAWWGFANATDRQRLEAFVRRGVRSGFYSANSPTVAELVCDSDDNLFPKSYQ